MKQKDYVLIVVVVIFSTVFSFILSNFLISPPDNRKATVEVIDPITPEFASPDPRYFNENSVDPTQNIRIGENPNPQPFDDN